MVLAVSDYAISGRTPSRFLPRSTGKNGAPVLGLILGLLSFPFALLLAAEFVSAETEEPPMETLVLADGDNGCITFCASTHTESELSCLESKTCAEIGAATTIDELCPPP